MSPHQLQAISQSKLLLPTSNHRSIQPHHHHHHNSVSFSSSTTATTPLYNNLHGGFSLTHSRRFTASTSTPIASNNISLDSLDLSELTSGEKKKDSTLVCVPLMGDTVDQMIESMAKAKESGADLVEIRLDYLKNFDPSQDLEKLIKL